MRFSIIVAVRNEVDHIAECINAVFHQDYHEPYEVIIVDGMSTDGTTEELTKLQKSYHFIVIKNPKINAAAGRNLGIKNASGDHVAFIDGDAIAAHDWLSQIQQAFEKSKAAGVGGPDLLPENTNETAHVIGIIMTSPFARGGSLNPSTQHALIEEERTVEHIPTCNVCFKKEILEKIGLFDEAFVKGQDLELNYRIIQAGYKLFYTPKIQVIHYRKQDIKGFSQQIYKWAKAKIAITKKHGVINHAYLLPLYGIIGVFVLFALSLVFHFIPFFFLLLFLGGISYCSLILFESARLAKQHNNMNIFIQGILFFPIIHFSYTYGIIAALIKRKIW
jgi:GT2 family glycosyltransferase